MTSARRPVARWGLRRKKFRALRCRWSITGSPMAGMVNIAGGYSPSRGAIGQGARPSDVSNIAARKVGSDSNSLDMERLPSVHCLFPPLRRGVRSRLLKEANGSYFVRRASIQAFQGFNRFIHRLCTGYYDVAQGSRPQYLVVIESLTTSPGGLHFHGHPVIQGHFVPADGALAQQRHSRKSGGCPRNVTGD